MYSSPAAILTMASVIGSVLIISILEYYFSMWHIYLCGVNINISASNRRHSDRDIVQLFCGILSRLSERNETARCNAAVNPLCTFLWIVDRSSDHTQLWRSFSLHRREQAFYRSWEPSAVSHSHQSKVCNAQNLKGDLIKLSVNLQVVGHSPWFLFVPNTNLGIVFEIHWHSL